MSEAILSRRNLLNGGFVSNMPEAALGYVFNETQYGI
jgi:hypothetical protein